MFAPKKKEEKKKREERRRKKKKRGKKSGISQCAHVEWEEKEKKIKEEKK